MSDLTSTTGTARSVPFSFEVYPPRTPDRMQSLRDSLDRLADAGPEFISVTYGAGGTSGGPSLDVLRHILQSTRVEPLAHLTCVGSTYAGAAGLIREFLDAGIDSFLALRGDPPAGSTEEDVFLGDLENAAQLVQLIDRAKAERSAFAEIVGPGGGGSRPRGRIAVAAFPGGHPRSRYPNQDIDALLAKQAAGADFAITQLFFYAEDYLLFVARARDAGVTIPILPGIMPVTSRARLNRVVELTGEPLPLDLAIALEAEPHLDGQREAGIGHAARLAREVLEGGAPGIHLYAFNAHATVLAVLREAGIRINEKEHAR